MVESDRTGAAQVGVVGLVVIGSNLARNFASHGRTVALYNRTLLVDLGIATELGQAQDGWRRTVSLAAAKGVPVPGFASALAFYDTVRRQRLPAALVQGLRDFFGAHTYRRVDRDGVFHTRWSEDRSEQEV